MHPEAGPKPGQRRRVGRMGEDTTAIEKRRKKSNEHDNHSRKTPVWKWRQVEKCSLDTYGHSAHGSS